MSIDKAAFATGMGLLAGAFNRSLDGAVSRAYYGVLSGHLSTAEFEQAVSRCLHEETFWPSPAVLLSKVKADDESRGHLAFEHVTRVLNQHGGFRYLTIETYHREFDEPTKAAISAVGGLSAISNTNEDRWAGLQKRFMAAYAASLRPALPSPVADVPEVKQLVRDTARAMSAKSYPLSGRDLAAGRDP